MNLNKLNHKNFLPRKKRRVEEMNNKKYETHREDIG